LPFKAGRQRGHGTVLATKGMWGFWSSVIFPAVIPTIRHSRKKIQDAGHKLREVIKEVDPQAMRSTTGTTSLMI